MTFLIVKALVSGIIIAIVSEVARKFPGLGGLIASLPLISVLGIIWLWRATEDPERMATHSLATFWFVLPSLPMFVLIPVMLKRGVPFWPTLAAACLLTMTLYAAMVWLGPKVGLKL
ncbi:MAG: DUF3147 family protein [Alphaproteobacteria bacterium]|jgi:hypothetical protein